MGPQQILLVRHAEKPALFGKPHGIDRDGEPHPHSLIVRGWQRAGALVPFFCEPRSPKLQRPTAVYSPPSHGADGDHGRPFETIVAIAERLNVEPDMVWIFDRQADGSYLFSQQPQLLLAGDRSEPIA